MNNNDLRDRFRTINNDHTPKEDSLLKLWDDQKRMQAEDKRLALELSQAKAQTKQLKRALRKNQLGESKVLTKNYVQKLRSIIEKFLRKSKLLAGRYPKRSFAVVAVLVLGVVGISIMSRQSSNNTGTLGDSTGITINEDLPRENPVFEPLTPNGAGQEQYDIVRISPDNAAPSYTFLDRFTDGGAIFRVTQQEVPPDFDLAKTATEFQATSIIQIDEMAVYHGYSEQGSTQSLLFIKDEKLFSIRSPQKFSDDSWVSYIMSLD